MVEFEKWLRNRVDTLSNRLKEYICEEWNEKQRPTKPKSSIRMHPLATGAEPSCEVPMESNAITDPNLNSQLHPLAMATAFSPRVQRDSNHFHGSNQGQANFQNN